MSDYLYFDLNRYMCRVIQLLIWRWLDSYDHRQSGYFRRGAANRERGRMIGREDEHI